MCTTPATGALMPRTARCAQTAPSSAEPASPRARQATPSHCSYHRMPGRTSAPTRPRRPTSSTALPAALGRPAEPHRPTRTPTPPSPPTTARGQASARSASSGNSAPLEAGGTPDQARRSLGRSRRPADLPEWKAPAPRVPGSHISPTAPTSARAPGHSAPGRQAPVPASSAASPGPSQKPRRTVVPASRAAVSASAGTMAPASMPAAAPRAARHAPSPAHAPAGRPHCHCSARDSCTRAPPLCTACRAARVAALTLTPPAIPRQPLRTLRRGTGTAGGTGAGCDASQAVQYACATRACTSADCALRPRPADTSVTGLTPTPMAVIVGVSCWIIRMFENDFVASWL